MDGESDFNTGHAWQQLHIRWGILLLSFAALSVYRSQIDLSIADSQIILVFVSGLLVNTLLIPFITVQRIRIYWPQALIISGLLLTAILLSVADGQGLLVAGIGGALLVPSMMGLKPEWGLAHAVGTLIVIFLVLFLSRDVEPSAETPNVILTLLIVLLLGGTTGGFAYAQAQQQAARQQRINRLTASGAEQLSTIQERMHMIYEMAARLSATLDYEEVLDLALNLGQLNLRNVNSQRLVSIVLLFRASDNQLQVINARALARPDEQRVIAGEKGAIGKSLREGIPVIADAAAQDPELRAFITLHSMGSILCIPLRAGFDNYGVLVYGTEEANGFTNEHIDLLSAIGTQVTVAMQNAVLYQNLAKEKERIVEIEEDARKKLARDLHDGPTQTVSAIAMRMSYIHSIIDNQPQAAADEIKKVEDLARKTVKEIRHMLFTLRPLALENQGLTAALNQLADKMRETYEQNVAIRVAEEAEQMLDSNHQGVIFYIVEEAVNNARKHAEAKLISAEVFQNNEYIVVRITDNGRGFDIGSVTSNYDDRGSLGMVNMRERTELIDGQLEMESVIGKGTRITILVPVKDEAGSLASEIDRPEPSQQVVTKLSMDAAKQFRSLDNPQ